MSSGWDSLGSGPENMRVANYIRTYICVEARSKFDMEFSESCIEMKLPKQVLQQNNDRDCGLCVLEHTRRFIADPATFLKRVLLGQLTTLLDVAMMRTQLACLLSKTSSNVFLTLHIICIWMYRIFQQSPIFISLDFILRNHHWILRDNFFSIV